MKAGRRLPSVGVKDGVEPPHELPSRLTASIAPVWRVPAEQQILSAGQLLALNNFATGQKGPSNRRSHNNRPQPHFHRRGRCHLPAFAPMRQPVPTEITSDPPPDSVPMIEAPPPMSEPSPTTTPAEIRPSTIEVPRVPALVAETLMHHGGAFGQVSAQAYTVSISNSDSLGTT